jgi:hypothetical protein
MTRTITKTWVPADPWLRTLQQRFQRGEFLPAAEYTILKAAFYSSDAWLDLKTAVLLRQKGNCFRFRYCGRPAAELHHLDRTRRRYFRLDPKGLAAVCSPCHDFLEGLQQQLVLPGLMVNIRRGA